MKQLDLEASHKSDLSEIENMGQQHLAALESFYLASHAQKMLDEENETFLPR